MKIKKTQITCANCKNVFQSRIKLSASSAVFGLDGKPNTTDFFRLIQLCPNCKYAGYDIEKTQPNGVVSSSLYNPIDPLSVYECAIAVSSDEDKLSLLMEYTWQLEFAKRNDEATAIRQRLADYLDVYLEEKPVIELILIYVDVLRQLGRFEEAVQLVEAVKPKVKLEENIKKDFYKIFIFEECLLHKGDSLPHLRSEV